MGSKFLQGKSYAPRGPPFNAPWKNLSTVSSYEEEHCAPRFPPFSS